MPPTTRYIIKRIDQRTEDIVIESEGLTIGRLPGNDLVLNHRAVAETHAGIKEIGDQYWLFSLSDAHGTILEGQVLEEAPLEDGAVAQIGPYLLRVARLAEGLSLTVEMAVGTAPGEEKKPVAGPLALSLSGFDAQSLRIFWQKRMREAGKIAEKTPLHPKGEQRIGKMQFNWGPTLDLRQPWRPSLFVWGGLLVAGLSALALLGYSRAFSPGELAAVHSTRAAPGRQLAARVSAGSCTECHAATADMSGKCAACHQTPQFTPTVSAAHRREGLGCVGCHSEHQGRSSEAGLLTQAICAQCHNDQYRIRMGERSGRILGVPHGGADGYPKVAGKWRWPGLPAGEWSRRQLPAMLAARPASEQFHALHRAIYVPGGAQARRIACRDCHTGGVPQGDRIDSAPRAACASCHDYSQGPASTAANCVTCHQPHGSSRDLNALIATVAGDYQRLKEAALAQPKPRAGMAVIAGRGGADVLRQERVALRWRMLPASAGALPWYGWLGLLALLPLAGLVWLARQAARGQSLLESIPPAASRAEEVDSAKASAGGPLYPHPVIDPLLCIGCHACVEACPHDVLDIVGGVATPVALDQCMEDTSCMVECPTSPKACVVINTKKIIPPRKVPRRDQRLMTNVPGIYLVGDVSGVPLIKNAINEGAQVIESIVEDLQGAAPNPDVPFDVAIIGVGPAGLSATALARQRGLRYVAIEQNRIVSTIQNFPAGKYVFFKPDTVAAKGGIPLSGVGGQKENLLAAWMESVMSHGLEIREEESCREIKPAGDHFIIATAISRPPAVVTYRAHRVILAIGNHGSPMKLGVPGEDLPGRVTYRLADPDEYRGQKCVIVGAGNSAVEAAVELTGFQRAGDRFTFTRDNDVALIVRSDLKGDLKLGNKMNLYDCLDAGKIRIFFGTTIKEVREHEVILMDARTKAETARLPNDHIFALIGSEKPTKFLEGIGLKIG